MKTQVKGVVLAPPFRMEYALSRGERAQGGERRNTGGEKERLKEMLVPLVKEAVRRQLKEQQEYYKSRPSLAAKQVEQVFGVGNLEKALTPAISLRVYGEIEDRIRHEWVRKGR